MHAQELEPAWLARLREIDPQKAEVFDTDPAKATKLDMLLAGTTSLENKVAIIRTALNGGLDPNDPAIVFAVQALGIQRLITHDFEETIESVKLASRMANESVDAIVESTKIAGGMINESTTKAVAAIRDAGDEAIQRLAAANTINDQHLAAIVGDIKKTTTAAIKKIESSGTAMQERFAAQVEALQTVGKSTQASVEALPERVAEINASLDERAAQSVEAAAAKVAEVKIDAATSEALADLSKIITGWTGVAKDIHELLRPLRASAERLAQNEKVFAFGRAFGRNEFRAGVIGIGAGTILGMLIFAFIANVMHLGIDPMLVSDAAAGRTYQGVWSGISSSCKAEIQTLVTGVPPTSHVRR